MHAVAVAVVSDLCTAYVAAPHLHAVAAVFKQRMQRFLRRSFCCWVSTIPDPNAEGGPP